MTPKEKAKELHAQFMKPVDGLYKYPMCFDTAKQCALICVEEIIKKHYDDWDSYSDYWKKVKKEIKQL